MKPTFFTFIFVLIANQMLAQWTNLSTGINDSLTGVVFKINNGLLCGRNIYYTTNGGVGASSWTEYSIFGNSSDSLIYENTKFYNAFSRSGDINNAFVCGEDTVNHKAVVFQFSFQTFSHTILYYGNLGSRLNGIAYSSISSKYYAVGNNGLIVSFNNAQPAVEETSGLTQDLNNISFNNGNFWIAAEDYKIYGVETNPGLSITTEDYVNNWHVQDVAFKPGTNYAVGVGDKVYHTTNGVVSTFTNYDFGLLNAKTVFYTNNYTFIGTDHGMFVSISGGLPSDSNPFEWVPVVSSTGIYDFWSDGVMYLYACGENGALFRRTGASLASGTKPYVRILPTSACEGNVQVITAKTGSANNCDWFVNGTQYGSSCGLFSHLYDTAGVYSIMLIGANYSYSDTSYFDLVVTAMPEVTNPYSVLDSILCHQGTIEIEIDQSQNDVFYELYESGTNNYFGASNTGNGGTIVFETNVLDEQGYYYLKSISGVNTNCKSTFTDSLFVKIDETKADFRLTQLNCDTNELVTFFNLSEEADYYTWNFEANSSIATSNVLEPITTYLSPSFPQEIQLIAWSVNDCYDTIIKNGMRIVEKPSPIDTSWVNNNQGPEAPIYQDPEINELIPLHDGYAIVGKYYNEEFGSRYGDSLTMMGTGGYLLKYDYEGMFRWKVESDRPILGVVEDSQKNIYICGVSSFWIVDNRNDTIHTPGLNGSYEDGFLLKLDSLGRQVWHVSGRYFRPENVFVDKSDNPYITGYIWYSVSEAPLLLNGVPSDTLHDYGIDYWHPVIMAKFDHEGHLSWEALYSISASNVATLNHLSFDAQNNVYAAGESEEYLKIYSPNNPNGELLPGFSVGGGHTFMTKMDSLGNLIWKTRSHTGYSNTKGTPFNLITDDNGTSYLGALNGVGHTVNPDPHFFENTDGTVTQTDGGVYCLMKINADGICEWINSIDYSYYGAAQRLILSDDKLYVLGCFRDANWETDLPDAKFINPDGTAFFANLTGSDYFIAEYDTTGYLHYLEKNGENLGYVGNTLLLNSFSGFFLHDDNSFYTTRNVFLHAGFTYNEWGHPMQTEDVDTWVVKFKKGDGIEIPMMYYSTSSASVCYGESYVFPDGSNQIVTTNISDTVIFTAANGMDSVLVTHIIAFPNVPQTNENMFVCHGDVFTYPDGFSETILSNTTHTSELLNANGCDSFVVTHVFMDLGPFIHSYDTVCIGELYTFPDGTSEVINAAVTHYDYYGCDSVLVSHVDLETILEVSIVGTPNAIVATSNGTAYQWYACFGSDLQALSGEVNQVLFPSVPGWYAVAAIDDNCSVISDCLYFNEANIAELSQNGFTLFPNPVKESFQFSHKDNKFVDFSIKDINGNTLLEMKESAIGDAISIAHLAPGTYFVYLLDSYDVLKLIKI